MGLALVELLMALEEGFGVTLHESEAAACVTPAAMTDLIFSKLRASDERVCVSQRAFYMLRKGLERTLGMERRSVVLNADLRSFTKCRSEREVWEDLKNAVQARHWPALVRPRWLVALLWFLSFGTFCGLVFAVHWMVAAALGLLIAFAGARITRRFRTRIPARYSQLRNLIPFAATSDAIAWTRDQVADLVRHLVTKHLGIREKQYRENAHFVKDLGLG